MKINKRLKKPFIYASVMLSLLPTLVFGQSSELNEESAFVRKSTDIQRTTLEPVIDGVLDDEIWQHATVITDLHQVNPVDTAPRLRKAFFT